MRIRRIHLVLSSGGIRVLAYVGAVQAFEAAGIEVASVSACSAGSVVGALVAAGRSGRELEQLTGETALERFADRPNVLARLFALRRWPFAPVSRTRFADLVADEIGADTTFQELPKPFATMGIDVVSGEYLVYTKETHPEMRVMEAVRIATAIPLVYPPHQVGDRLIVDASIGTQAPVWLTAAVEGFFDESLPIVVLRTTRSAQVERPRRLGQYLSSLFAASVIGGDDLLIRGDPRVHTIEFPTASVSALRFDLDRQERARLIRVGRSVTEDAIDRVDGDFAAAQLHVRSAAARMVGGHDAASARANDETAAWAGAHYAQQFLTAPARDVFISYSHKDRAWFQRILQRLRPLVAAGTITIWSDEDTKVGQFWRRQINEAIGRARVALLLVSPSYLDSDFVTADELPALIRAAEERRTVLMWIHVSRAQYKAAPIAHLQALHDPSQPLDTLGPDDLDRALSRIADEVAQAFKSGIPLVAAGTAGSQSAVPENAKGD